MQVEKLRSSPVAKRLDRSGQERGGGGGEGGGEEYGCTIGRDSVSTELGFGLATTVLFVLSLVYNITRVNIYI